MSATVPELRVPARGAVPERELWSRPSAWDAFEPVPLVNATDGTPARHATEARVAWDADAIHLRVRVVFPFENAPALELVARGARAMPAPSRERLQELLGKAVAAGLQPPAASPDHP